MLLVQCWSVLHISRCDVLMYVGAAVKNRNK